MRSGGYHEICLTDHRRSADRFFVAHKCRLQIVVFDLLNEKFLHENR